MTAEIASCGTRDGGTERDGSHALVLHGKRIPSAEGVVLELAMLNRGEHRYWVRKKWVDASEEAPRAMFPVWFEVWRGSTRSSDAHRGYPFDPVSHVAYFILAAGDEHDEDYELAAKGYFPSPGCYRMRAHYQDLSGEEPSSPKDVLGLSQELVSSWSETYVTAADIKSVEGMPIH